MLIIFKKLIYQQKYSNSIVQNNNTPIVMLHLPISLVGEKRETQQ